MNKEIRDLERYVNEKVLTTLSTAEKHKVDEATKCLDDRYGRTRLEKLEELVVDWIKLRRKIMRMKVILACHGKVTEKKETDKSN